MRLDVSKALVSEGSDIAFSVEGMLPDTVLMDETVSFPSPVRLQGFYASVGDTVHVRGTMAFEATSICVRCLKNATQAFHVPFDVLYALTPDPDNPDIYVYGGAWIDLTAMAQDVALLALPMQWHCSEDCRGLCPVCGADRNENACSCRMEATDRNPFSALQQLLTKDESEV